MNREYVEVQIRQARHDFMVENWPPHLQRASKIERKLLEMMRHPNYWLVISHDKLGGDYADIDIPANVSNPLTSEATRFMCTYSEELMGWVKHTNEINARIERLTKQLREMETTE